MTAYVTDRAGEVPTEGHDRAGVERLPAGQLGGGPGSCGWCGAELPVRTGRGRRRRYCSDACRSRAARDRNPRPPACQLRVGDWPCGRPAVAYLREPDDARPGKFKLWGFTAACCETCLPLVEAFAAASGHSTCRQSIEEHRAEVRAGVAGEPDEEAPAAAGPPDPAVGLLEGYVRAVGEQLAAALVASVLEVHAWRGDDGRLTACLTLDQDNGIDGPWLLVWDEETGWRASPLDPRTGREVVTEYLHRGGVLPAPEQVVAWIEDVVLAGRVVHCKPKLFRRANNDDQFIDQLRAAAAQ